jgi:hypothetical protein
MRKQCTCCGIEKSTKEFYKKTMGLYGLHAECKTCLKEKNKIYREENPEKIKIRDRCYAARLKEQYGESNTHSHVRIAERSLIGFERYAETKMQLLAGSLLNYGIRIGMIEKPDKCSNCRKIKEIQGHHSDYSKPLEVVWVCTECHAKLHTRM